jgi:arylsulfatase A-like enzyme
MPADSQPNLLLITSDQQHWNTLGIDNPRINTPNLDRLAREGTLFDRAYCPNPTCSPTRASIITGMYPAWHGCWTIGVMLPEDVPTLGDALQDNGYHTTLIGKAHFQPLASTPESPSIECHPKLRDLDFWRRFHGPWYGFQHIEVARGHADEHLVGQHYAIWMEEKGLKNWPDYFDEWPPNRGAPQRRHAWDLPEELHYTTWTGERTIANLERHAAEEQPFCLWSSFHDPHPPYLVPEPWASMYRPEDMEPGGLSEGELDLLPPHFRKTQEKDPDFSMYRETHGPHGFHSHLVDEALLRRDIATYYGMISFMDRWIGEILDALERLGLAQNTLVVFASDHGHFLGQHGLIAKGAFHFEDMLRVPMIVRWPGRVPAGRRTPALQSLVDLAPTFLAAAGIEVPGIMQGVNQLDVWRGRAETARDHIIVENRHEPTLVHVRTYVDERYKITVYRDREYGELFDLQEDPRETRNLWDDPGSAALKCRLLHRFMNAELKREPTRMERIAGA